MTTIYSRKATLDDLEDIMAIIDEAKAMMKAEGSPQWQSGDPDENTIKADMEKGYSYVLIVDGEIAGTACLFMEHDPSYDVIDGAWANNTDPYATIHRIAISSKYRGQRLNNYFFSNLYSIALENGFKHMRIDTYKLNERMQKVALRLGFEYRGIVHVNDPIDSERYAYEISLED